MRTLIILQETDVESIQIEELLLAQRELRTIDDGYQDYNMESPEWVIDKLASVGAELKARFEGELKRQLKTRKARLLALRSKSEEKRDLEREIKELEAKLA